MLHSSVRKANSEWVSLMNVDIYTMIPAGELKWPVNFLVTLFPFVSRIYRLLSKLLYVASDHSANRKRCCYDFSFLTKGKI